MRHVAEVTLEEARAVPDGDPLARWAATVEALHAKCAALRKRVADVEHDLNREVEARNAAGAELDAVLAHADELTKALRETQRQRDALRRAARAMYGADHETLRGLAPEAMRAVLTKRGWHLDGKAMWYADRSVVAAEVWEHATARATKPGQPWLKRVEVLVLPDAADKATRVAEWADAVASRHGDVSAVEVLAEALLEVTP